MSFYISMDIVLPLSPVNKHQCNPAVRFLTRGESISFIVLKCAFCWGGGVLSGKVSTGMCGPDRVLFWPLRYIPMAPFYLKIGLD